MDDEITQKKEYHRLVSAMKYWINNTEDGFHDETSYNELRDLIDKRKGSLKRRPSTIKFGPDYLPDHYTCYYCKLADEKVEAGGIWYCPNFTCSGPGAHTHRRKLSSYKENEDGTHTVDDEEWISEAENLLETMKEIPLKEAIKAGIKRLKVQITGSKMGL